MNKEAKIQSIKDFIDARFNTMNNDEFENLCNGDGTLSVLDDALAEYDVDNTLDENDISELADYCCNKSDEVYEKYYTRFENFSDEHKQLLERMAKSMMQRFAETVTAEQYDDLDEWIDFIQKFECFTFQELQYINRLWTDEAKEKYRIQKD